jgi:methylene-tetrahydromethanopterin dehydrogenase
MGTPIAGSPSGAVGIGALAIGNIKYQTQNKLLNLMRHQMRKGDKPVYLHFENAFGVAREFARKR